MVKPRLHTQEMPAYLDKEVSSADRDKFGHAHLAAALRGLIEDEKHRPPYSVGLLGKMGNRQIYYQRALSSPSQE